MPSDRRTAPFMNRLSRDIFVERTRELLTRQGCTDVSLSTVLNACDANKGSLYHFFPKGKDELVVAAIQRQAGFAISMNQDFLTRSDSTAEAVFHCLESLAKKMAASDFNLCLPFSAVGAISGDASEELRSACADTLAKLESLFAESLKREGLSAKLAKEIASLIVSTVEGALLQARTRKIATPLKVAATALRSAIEFHTSAS